MSVRRYKLCLFTDSFDHGGTERQFTQVVTRLDRSKYDIIVGCMKQTGPFYEQVRAAGLEVVEFLTRGFISVEAANSWWRWFRLIRKERFDLVHTFGFYSNLFALPMAHFAGVPVVIGSRRNTAAAWTPRQLAASKRAFLWSDMVVANSDSARDELVVDGIPKDRVRTVRNGLDLDRFTPQDKAEARRKLGWSEKDLLVSVVASLLPKKDHRTLIAAAPEIVKQVPNVRFMLIGSGPLEQELRQQAEKNGVANNVVFLGERRDIPEILSAVDMSVLPTRVESLPNVVMEAMSAGRAVVASDVGGCGELIEDGKTGFLVKAQDPQALAQAILRLLQNADLREQMGRAARAHAEAEFSIQRSVERFQNIYDELLARKVGARDLVQSTAAAQ